MNNESSDFADDFSDASMDDFLKEFPEWDIDFNPWEFGSMMPNVGIPSEFTLSPWRELRRQLFLFLMHVLPPDYHTLSVAEEPGEEIEKRCDDWIRTFVNATKRKGMVPPADVRKWAAIRARRALISSEFESIQEEEYKTPDVRGNFAHEIISRLVDRWHDEGKQEWLRNPRQTATDEVTTITCHIKETGVTLKPATSWAEVLTLAETMLKLVDLKERYPVGKTGTELHDGLCELWLRDAIFARDRTGLTPDRDTAPWLAARLHTAKTLIKSHIREGSRAPWPEGDAQQALYVLVVSEWKKKLSDVWLGFHYQKGKLTWDPSRSPRKDGFSAN